MNDLYIESRPFSDDDADLECDECGCYIVEVNRDPERVCIAYTAEEAATPQPLCDGCTDNLADSYKGNVHDRREDAEALLREVACAVMSEIPQRSPHLVALVKRIARR